MLLVVEDTVLIISETFPLVIFIDTYKRWRCSNSEPFTSPWTAIELKIGLNSSRMKVNLKSFKRRKNKFLNHLGGMILMPEEETSQS